MQKKMQKLGFPTRSGMTKKTGMTAGNGFPTRSGMTAGTGMTESDERKDPLCHPP